MDNIEHTAYLLDKKGCFSRPDEQIEAFIDAAPRQRRIEQTLLPNSLIQAFSETLCVDIRSLSIEESSQGLFPWELACCWTDRRGNASIRLRPKSKRSSYLSRDTVLVHECIHAIRARLDSSIFEEFCAYDLSSELAPLSAWRRFLGPLFSSAKEACLFLLLLWTTLFTPLFFDSWYPWLLLLLPITHLSALFIRLYSRWNVWNKAKKALASYCTKASALLVRMSDEEIRWLSSLDPSEIHTAIEQQSSSTWRWVIFKKFT